MKIHYYLLDNPIMPDPNDRRTANDVKTEKMKSLLKHLLTSCLIILALLLTGCNNEETTLANNATDANSNSNSNGKKQLTFILPLGNKTVTYSESTIEGLEAEYRVDNLFIYWFKNIEGTKNVDALKLYKVLSWAGTDGSASAGLNITTTGNVRIVTIDIDEGFTAESRFYILANVNGEGFTGVSSLQSLDEGVSDANSGDWLTDALAATAENGIEVINDRISTPLPMVATYTVYDPTQSVVHDVTLKRRVARFDILNNASQTGLTINKIYISNAQRRAYVVRDEPFTWKDDLQLGNMEINATGTANGNPESDDPARNEAVFYLYPTRLTSGASGAAERTEIVIEGTLNGETTSRLYTLELELEDYDEDENETYGKVILSNSVYTINVLVDDTKTVAFNLEAEKDWTIDSEDDYNAVFNYGVQMSAAWVDGEAITFTYSRGTTESAMQYYLPGASLVITAIRTDNRKPLELSITKSYFGEEEIEYWEAIENAVTNAVTSSSTTLTYGARYETKYTIIFPEFTKVYNMTATLKIKDKNTEPQKSLGQIYLTAILPQDPLE
jgi:hypothetical protein